MDVGVFLCQFLKFLWVKRMIDHSERTTATSADGCCQLYLRCLKHVCSCTQRNAHVFPYITGTLYRFRKVSGSVGVYLCVGGVPAGGDDPAR